MRLGLIFCLTASLAACASDPMLGDEQRQTGDATIEGWAHFLGEFAIYDSPRSLRQRSSGRCVSGALPLEQQRSAAKTYEGKKVRVIGRLVPWFLSEPLAVSMNHAGSPIKNECGGKSVLFAESIATID